MSLGLYVRFPTVYRPVLFMPSYLSWALSQIATCTFE